MRDEKLKVLRAVQPMHAGEVAAATWCAASTPPGWVEGTKCRRLPRRARGRARLETETFVALRLDIDIWRWAGVPFYLRTGQGAADARHRDRGPVQARRRWPSSRAPATPSIEPNILAIRIQPDEGILLRFGAKVPGQGMQIRSVNMDFRYGLSFAVDSPDAYETLLLDAMLGDAAACSRATTRSSGPGRSSTHPEVWAGRRRRAAPLLRRRDVGTAAADELLERDGRAWRRP